MNNSKEKNRISNIDETDKKILLKLEEGKTYQEIADALFISRPTVVNRIMKMRTLGYKIPNSIEIRKSIIKKLILKYLKEKAQQEILDLSQLIKYIINKLNEQGFKISSNNKIRKQIRNQQILIYLEENKTYQEIADFLKIEVSMVYSSINEMKKQGIKIPNNVELRNKQILQYLEEGKTYQEIADALQIGLSTVFRNIKMMKKQGIKIPNNVEIRKEKVNQQIRECLAKHEKPIQIAKKLGITVSAVCIRIKGMEKKYSKEMDISKTIENLITDVFSNNNLNEVYRILMTRLAILKSEGIDNQDIRKIVDIIREIIKEHINNVILEDLKNGIEPKYIAKKHGLTQEAVVRRINAMKAEGLPVSESLSNKELGK